MTATTTTAANTTTNATLAACQNAVRRVLGTTLPKDAAPHQLWTAFDALWAKRPIGMTPSGLRRVMAAVLEGVNPGYGLTYRASKLAAAPTPAAPAPAAPTPTAVVEPKPAAPAPAPTTAGRKPVMYDGRPASALEALQWAFSLPRNGAEYEAVLDAAEEFASHAAKRLEAADAPKPAPAPVASKPAATPAPVKPAAPKPAPTTPPAPAAPKADATLAEVQSYCNGKDYTLGGLRALCTRCGVTADTKCAAAMKAALLEWKPAAPAPVETPKPAAQQPKPADAPKADAKPAAPTPVAEKAARTGEAILASLEAGKESITGLKKPEMTTLAGTLGVPAATAANWGALRGAVSAALKDRKAAKGKPAAAAPTTGKPSEAVQGLLRALREELAGNVDALAALELVEDAASK